jgi:hypothetical protein
VGSGFLKYLMKKLILGTILCLVLSACSQSSTESGAAPKSETARSLEKIGDDLADAGDKAKDLVVENAEVAKEKAEAALKAAQKKIEEEAKKVSEKSTTP